MGHGRSPAPVEVPTSLTATTGAHYTILKEFWKAAYLVVTIDATSALRSGNQGAVNLAELLLLRRTSAALAMFLISSSSWASATKLR